jgi:hypothetical protein
MAIFRAMSPLLLCLLLIQCEANRGFKVDKRIFYHWINNDSLHMGGFIISNDSIYYPDYKRSFPYVVDKDSLEVIMIDKRSKSAYKILNGTLIFTSKEGTQIFWRKR